MALDSVIRNIRVGLSSGNVMLRGIIKEYEIVEDVERKKRKSSAKTLAKKFCQRGHTVLVLSVVFVLIRCLKAILITLKCLIKSSQVHYSKWIHQRAVFVVVKEPLVKSTVCL